MPVRTRFCEMKARDILQEAGITLPPVDVQGIAESFFLQVVQSDTSRHGGRAFLNTARFM